MDVTISPDLADRLNAAWLDRNDLHHPLCTVFTVGATFGCSCGTPRLLDELAQLLGVDAADFFERAEARAA